MTLADDEFLATQVRNIHRGSTLRCVGPDGALRAWHASGSKYLRRELRTLVSQVAGLAVHADTDRVIVGGPVVTTDPEGHGCEIFDRTGNSIARFFGHTASSVSADSDGNVYVIGRNNAGIKLDKYDSSGSLVEAGFGLTTNFGATHRVKCLSGGGLVTGIFDSGSNQIWQLDASGDAVFDLNVFNRQLGFDTAGDWIFLVGLLGPTSGATCHVAKRSLAAEIWSVPASLGDFPTSFGPGRFRVSGLATGDCYATAFPLISKIDADGDVEWTYDLSPHLTGFGNICAVSSGVYVSGVDSRRSPVATGNPSSISSRLLFVDATSEVQWDRPMGNSLIEAFNNMAPSPDGSLFIVGNVWPACQYDGMA